MKVTSYKTNVLRRYEKGIDQASKAYNTALLDSIRLPHFWEGFEDSVTHRKSGEVVVGAYRTITDLKNLLNSQDMKRKQYNTIWSWDGNGQTPVQYVYFGTRGGDRFIPGRDWTSLALTKVDLGKEFIKGFVS